MDEPLFLPSPERYQQNEHYFPTTADVVVVGGGLVGLSAAVELASRGRTVSVLCQSLQRNHTTTGVGMLQCYLPVAAAELEVVHGDDTPSVVQSSVDAYRWTLEKLAAIDRHFPCRIAGHLVCGHHSDDAKDMKRLVRFEQQRKGKASFLSQTELMQQIGSKRFSGALSVSDAAVVDPGQIHVGFHHIARMMDIPIFDETRVLRIDGLARGGFEIRTSKGRVRAASVLVCTGHELGALIPSLRSKVGEHRSITIATRPIEVEQQQRLAPANRIMSTNTEQRSYWYFDPSRGRLVFSMAAQSDDLSIEKSQAIAQMNSVYPELDASVVDQAWFSSAPITRDRVPRVGMVKGIGFAVKGDPFQLAYSSWLGYQASELMMNGNPHRGSTRPWSTIDLPGGQGGEGMVGVLSDRAAGLLANYRGNLPRKLA